MTIEGECDDNIRATLISRVRKAVLCEANGWLPTSNATPLSFRYCVLFPTRSMEDILMFDVNWSIFSNEDDPPSLHIDYHEESY